jgi:hypothetical protein
MDADKDAGIDTGYVHPSDGDGDAQAPQTVWPQTDFSPGDSGAPAHATATTTDRAASATN